MIPEIEQGIGFVLECTPLDEGIGFIGFADEFEGEIEQVGKEVGTLLVGLRLPEHVPGCKPSLLDCVVPVLQPPANAKGGIEKIDRIASGIDVGPAGAHILIHDDAVINCYAAACNACGFRFDADTHDRHVAGHFPPALRSHPANPALSVKLLHCIAQKHIHPALPEIIQDECGDARCPEPVEHHALPGDQGDLEPHLGQ